MGSFLIARMKVRYSPNHYLLLVIISFGTTARCVDYAGIHVFKCPD